MSMMQAVAAQQGVLANMGGDGVVAGQFALVSDGDQWIDLGLPLQTSNDIKCLHTYTSPVPSEGYAIGSFQGAVAATIGLVESTVHTRYWGSSYESGIAPVVAGTKYTLEKIGSRYKINDVDVGELSGTVPSQNAYLFARNTNGGNATNLTAGKSESVEIWTDATRATYSANMWAVPQGMTAEGATTAAPSNCMWDAVSGTYKENQGTGAFTFEPL